MRTKVTYHPHWRKQLLSPAERRRCKQRLYLGQCVDEIYMLKCRKLPKPQLFEFSKKDEILKNINSLIKKPTLSPLQLKINSVKRQLFREQRPIVRKKLKPKRNRSINTPNINYRRRSDCQVKRKRVRRNYLHGAWREVQKRILRERLTKMTQLMQEQSELGNDSDLSDCEEDDIVEIQKLETHCMQLMALNDSMVEEALRNVYYLRTLASFLRG